MNAQSESATPASGPSRAVTLAMAVACGVAVANIYYNQPLLGIMERAFPGQNMLVGFVPTVTQLGYALGIFLLVPLGDRLRPRTLILTQLCIQTVALLALALAPGAWTLIGASALVGFTGTVAQEIIPFAADLAEPGKRGATIGTVMSGLLCGILLGRTLAGFVGQHFGWRLMYGLSIVLVLATASMLSWVLPRVEAKTRMTYRALIGSLVELIRREPRLRLATATQTCLFASFSAFWTILALRLEQPPYRMGADIAGLFGVLGAFGILAAPLVGRIADRRGPAAGIALGIAMTLACWLLLATTQSIALMAVGVVILDLGLQSAMISHQHIIFALRPDARNRVNTVFVGGLFLGSAAGSAGATLCWHMGGWTPVCLYGGGLTAAALGLLVFGRSSRKPSIA